MRRRALLLAALMSCASALAVLAAPTIRIADLSQKVVLENLVPTQFGEWKMDAAVPQIQPNPEVVAALGRIYNETLARTYINRRGDRIMLSIAYGGDQNDSMKIHRPEGCYVGQGFQITSMTTTTMPTLFGTIPVRRLVAVSGIRNEPISYWMVIGDKLALSDVEIKLIKLRYAFRHEIPDGMLIRVSNISEDNRSAFELHHDFVSALVAGMAPDSRYRIVGAKQQSRTE